MRISLERYSAVLLFTLPLVVIGTGCSGLGAGNTSRITQATAQKSKSWRNVSVSVTPSTVLLASGAMQQFTASVGGTNNASVIWSTSGGTISSSGLYTAPTSAGTYSVTATSTANTSVSASATVNVTNTTSSVTPTYLLSISPSLISFGSVTIGSTANQLLTLSNTGNSSVTISAGNITGSGYSLTGTTFPLTISAGASMGVNIAFTPQTSGTLSGSVSLISNATNSPSTASLTGAGAAPILHSVTLNWIASTSTVSGYNIYRGTASGGPFGKLNANLQPGTSFNDSNVQSGAVYYYYVTAVDSTGTESGPSNEISALIPTP